MIKSDTPQRNINTGHNGVGATEVCNKCSCVREDVWDVRQDVSQLRYRVGIHDAILKAKESMPPALFERFRTLLGFTGADSPFRGLTFCPFRQGPVEGYHVILLGEVRYFLL